MYVPNYDNEKSDSEDSAIVRSNEFKEKAFSILPCMDILWRPSDRSSAPGLRGRRDFPHVKDKRAPPDGLSFASQNPAGDIEHGLCSPSRGTALISRADACGSSALRLQFERTMACPA